MYKLTSLIACLNEAKKEKTKETKTIYNYKKQEMRIATEYEKPKKNEAVVILNSADSTQSALLKVMNAYENKKWRYIA
jgi:hypothetical protein